MGPMSDSPQTARAEAATPPDNAAGSTSEPTPNQPDPSENPEQPKQPEKPAKQAKPEAAKGEPPEPPADLSARVEAALLTSDRALPAAKLAEALGGLATQAINEAIETLNADYEKTGRSFRIEAVAGGWKVMTLPEYGDVLDALHKKRGESKLSPAALETLAIIAYKQPVLRAEVEAIRGAASGEVIRSLMERHLIKIVGRAEEIGRPMLYGTTKTFLEVFGLSSLKDLPQVEQLNAGRDAS